MVVSVFGFSDILNGSAGSKPERQPKAPYSPECVEGLFSEVRLKRVLRSSLHASNDKQPQEYAIW